MSMTEWAARAVNNLVSSYLKKEFPHERWIVGPIYRDESLVEVSTESSRLNGLPPTELRWPFDSKTLRDGVVCHAQSLFSMKVQDQAPDSDFVSCMKSTVASASNIKHVMGRENKKIHQEDKQEPICRKVKKQTGLQVAGKRTTGVNRWLELDVEGSDLLHDEHDEFRLSDEMASIGDRIRAAYARTCCDLPFSRQGLFLGDDLDMTFSDTTNGVSFFGHDRSGHSGRVRHAK